MGGKVHQVIHISYRDSEPFDWYQRYNGIKELLEGCVAHESRILNLGAGNSRLSEEMFDEGFQNITNIDISSTVVKAMNEKYKDKPTTFKYLQMDARAMDFPDNSFDVIIDKATLDSVLVRRCLFSADKVQPTTQTK